MSTTRYVATTGSDSNSGTSSSPYLTISNAISNCLNGDIISVGSGTYTEKVIVNKSVTLLGANKDKTATEVQNALIQSKIVGGFTLNTSNITINGFEIISDTTNSYPIIGNTTANNNNDIVIKSNYIHNIKSQQGIYRAVTTNFVSNWLIDNNYVSDFMSGTSNTTAMYPNGIDGLTVTNNIIKHYTNGANRRGLNIDGCSSITINNNTIDMNRDAYDDIYSIQLYWSHQKNGNIGPIVITNNNLIGAYYGVAIVNKHVLSYKNTIDGVTISNNTFDTIDWLGLNIGNFWSYNYNFIMKNVSIYNNIFKNMAFLTMTIGPEYDTNYSEFGTFDPNNPPIQNCRIYNNSYIDNNNNPTQPLINLYSSPTTNANPTIIYSNDPATATNNNGVILDDSLKYLHRANINGSSGYYGPIPNPVRIISNSNTDYLFNSYSDYFAYVNNFTGITDKHIINMLTNETRISDDGSNLQKILDYVAADNSLNIVLNLDDGTYIGNLTINNSVTLLGANKATTIIQPPSNTTTATIQITDNSSGTNIKNVTVRGKYDSQTNISDSNNNTSAILVLNTNTTTNPAINNITLENLLVKNASNGIAFNNKHSNNINIKTCVIENNQGSGIRVASNTETMNGLNIESCTIQNNNLNAITSNPSANDRPNCTNFTIKSCTIKDNNLLTKNNSHDVSIFGFNGNIEISDTTIHSNHQESKLINGSGQTIGGWGLIINGYGSTTIPYKNSGNITLNNLKFTGNVIKSCLGIDRYTNLGNIVMNNVDLKDYVPNKAGQTWLQLVIGHQDSNKKFNIGNTKLKTLQVSQTGDIDARQALFYNILTGQLLNRQDSRDVIQIALQIADRLDYPALGGVLFNEGNNYVAPNEPNGLINAILEADKNTIINLLPGEYIIGEKIITTPSNILILKSINGISTIRYEE